MQCAIRHITIDCREPYPLALFWSDVLGYVDDPTDPNHPDDPVALIIDPERRRPGLLFIPVPEEKSVKNRVHLDLQPALPRDVTVDSLLDRGATLVADHRNEDGTGWAVLADPEGNEFCVERSADERSDGSDPAPPAALDRPYPPVHTAGERALLVETLDWNRDGVVAKLAGLDDRAARRRLTASSTTIAGLVKHLALVEDSWFTDRFAGQPLPEPWASAPFDDDPDWEFHSAEDEPLDDLVQLYLAACERSRAAVDGHGLDGLAVTGRPLPFTLRYVFVHMIEETARHLGHLDILREQLDGAKGV